MNPPIHSEAIQTWLEAWLSTHQAGAGTVHVTHDGALHLAAHVHIPPPVRAAVALVPPGKGMAGLAMVRRDQVDFASAQELLLEALAQAPNHVLGRYTLAGVYEQKREWWYPKMLLRKLRQISVQN